MGVVVEQNSSGCAVMQLRGRLFDALDDEWKFNVGGEICEPPTSKHLPTFSKLWERLLDDHMGMRRQCPASYVIRDAEDLLGTSLATLYPITPPLLALELDGEDWAVCHRSHHVFCFPAVELQVHDVDMICYATNSGPESCMPRVQRTASQGMHSRPRSLLFSAAYLWEPSRKCDEQRNACFACQRASLTCAYKMNLRSLCTIKRQLFLQSLDSLAARHQGIAEDWSQYPPEVREVLVHRTRRLYHLCF